MTDAPHAAVTGIGGRFRIGGVPAGLWRLTVWHEALDGAEATDEIRPGETYALERELLRKSR